MQPNYDGEIIGLRWMRLLKKSESRRYRLRKSNDKLMNYGSDDDSITKS